MTPEPQDFARCAGKSLTLDMQMGKAPIPETYKCGTCLRHYTNSPSHPAEKTNCALIDPWPDFTPCENFVALRWDAPVSDEALHKMAMSEIQSLSPCVRKAVIQDLELGLLGSAFKQINQQQGWTMDGNFDYALKTRRTLLHDTFQHEMKRRKHAA